jgi:dihydrodipicolinate synthase/N-acetylneuraminate lyase
MKALRIQGVVPPVPTPFAATGRLDVPAVHRIVDHLIEGGCDALFILGSTGELPSLSRDCRESMIHTSVQAVAGRIPLLVGIGDTCVQETLNLGRLASDAGADALVLTAPCYYDLAADELKSYFTSILPQLDRPTLLYNMPWLTGHVLDSDCLRAAVEHTNVIGFKDSSGDMAYLQEMISVAATSENCSVLVGNEYFYLEALKLGAQGVVGGGANIYPEIFRALQDSFDRGDVDAASALQSEVTRLGKSIFDISGRPTSVFSAVKAGLAALGLCAPTMAPPLTSFTPAQVGLVREIIATRKSQLA